MPIQLETVSGQVTDAASGDPLPGVNVVVMGTTTGTSTDSEGSYELTVPSLQDTLIFSFIGYRTTEVPINGRSNIDLELQIQAVSSEELVVVGYGTQQRKDVISGISTLNVEEAGLQDLSSSSAVSLLKGRVSGVNVRNNTGAAGSTPVIRVRGISSINAGVGPLVVVDGFPVGTSFPQSLNPDEISDITVLKDAEATAIYGARGSNGVVIIETKNARTGQSEFSFNTSFNVSQVPQSWRRPMVIDPIKYAQYNKERIRALDDFNNVSSPTPIPDIFQDVLNNREEWRERGGTDWLDELLREGTESFSHQHNLTYRTGNERIRTVISGGFLDQQGLITADEFQRLTLRTKLDATISDRIRMGINLSSARTDNKRVDTDGRAFGSLLGYAILGSPLQSPYDENGNLRPHIPADSPGYFSYPNPMFAAQENTDQLIGKDLQANVHLEINIMEGLEYVPRFYRRLLTEDIEMFNPSTVGSRGLGSPGNLNAGAPPQPNNGSFEGFRLDNWGIDNLLRYQRTFGDHSFNLTLGHTIQKEEATTRQTEGALFPSDEIVNFNQAGEVTASNDFYEWSLLAGFGRLNYNFQNKYLTELNFRREGSSRLGSNNKYGNFPSGSIGWRISEENFYPDDFFLNEFLLRGSIGKTGNNAIGNFDAIGRLASIRTVRGGDVQEAKYLSNFSNNELKWETAIQYQVGARLGLLNDLLRLEIDYYEKTTKDMLFSVPLPGSAGFDNARINFGEMVNKGIDIEVNTFAQLNRIQWNSNLNMSFMSNEVTKMPDQINQILSGGRGGRNITKVGEPVGAHHGFIRLGLFDEETIEDPNLYGWRGGEKILGTNIFKDTNGDGFIDRRDMTVIGSPHPDLIVGFNNQITYKNISLSVLLSGMFGYEIADGRVGLNQVARWNINKAMLNRWKSPEEPGDGFVPRVEVNPGSREWMDDWLKPGDHLWIKNINVGYNMPSSVVQSMGIKNLRLYLNIENAARFDNFEGFNPEVGSSDPLQRGRDDFIYPVARTFAIGANITF
ncbi:MAG: SusC/RagA family TonB-linked outer membrane protein [Fulvivirga sp.]|nr:SusC/RagA family TonB-linked outer membrane protein [Fulvivirga sp.]